jgi:NADH-quinone oxidoreductase subunit E
MTKILSQKFYTDLGKLEKRYPNKKALILPALHKAQEEFGWLPKEVLAEVAEYIGVHEAQIREVASFYTMYNLKPVGKHHLKICL